ncbi:MAG: tetratricopeptide repeat protein [Anaerolineae bacterium]|nr:tetratricopeptide repeat protein [Anaerolineae bacterium]
MTSDLEERLTRLDVPDQPSRDLVDALNDLARAVSATDPTRAQHLSKRALQLSSHLVYREGEARALTFLSWLSFLDGRTDLALTRALNAEAVARLAHEPKLEGHALYMVALIHDQVGNFAEAVKAHQKMVAIAREVSDELLEANSLMAMGLQHSRQGNHKKALDCFMRTVAIFRSINADNEFQVTALNNVASALIETGDVLRALDYAQNALAQCNPDNARSYIQILDTLGNVYAAMGQLDEALAHYTRAIQMNAEAIQNGQVTDPEFEANAQLDLAKVQRALNQREQVFAALQRALEVAQALDTKPLLVQIHDQLSKAYRETGQVALALAHAEQREIVRTSLQQITSERHEKVIRLMAILQASRQHIHQEQCQAAQDWLWKACLHGNAPTC